MPRPSAAKAALADLTTYTRTHTHTHIFNIQSCTHKYAHLAKYINGLTIAVADVSSGGQRLPQAATAPNSCWTPLPPCTPLPPHRAKLLYYTHFDTLIYGFTRAVYPSRARPSHARPGQLVLQPPRMQMQLGDPYALVNVRFRERVHANKFLKDTRRS